ncbi:hypothetical protein FSP39_024376 [Pinctada imbricata]|uniref:Uncharacterized protein n=1 Tax=Pinctada imbricata TaxID=66713 RepID=A0AA88YM51_PINIB|nr:hypothetical protein FSP39_024376 [Pinctada imbricata]
MGPTAILWLLVLALGTTCQSLSSKSRQCICAGRESLHCMQLVGVFKDDSFVISPTKILMTIFVKPHTARRINRRWLFNTPVLGYESKSTCNGVNTIFHVGLPANEISVEHHVGTDGTDTKVEGSLDGIKVGVHGGTDADGHKQGGASIGVGVGKFGEVGLHVDGGASGVAVGGHGKVEVPGVGKAEGQVDVNNQGHVVASGNANGPVQGICVGGSKDVTEFIDNAGMSNIQSMSGMNALGGTNGMSGMSPMNGIGMTGMGGAGNSPYGFQPGSLG